MRFAYCSAKFQLSIVVLDDADDLLETGCPKLKEEVTQLFGKFVGEIKRLYLLKPQESLLTIWNLIFKAIGSKE